MPDRTFRLRVQDTLTEHKVRIAPPPRKPLTIYVCGVTPYDSGHMGHAFTFSIFDVLVRFAEANGQRVRYVQNVTDIDDPLFEAHVATESTGKSWQCASFRCIFAI